MSPVRKLVLPEREHTQHRKVALTIEFVLRNPNPPHVFDATDADMEVRLAELASNTVVNSLPYNQEEGRGFIHADFLPEDGHIRVDVKCRECEPDGSRSLWSRIVYLLTGRYNR